MQESKSAEAAVFLASSKVVACIVAALKASKSTGSVAILVCVSIYLSVIEIKQCMIICNLLFQYSQRNTPKNPVIYKSEVIHGHIVQNKGNLFKGNNFFRFYHYHSPQIMLL